MATATKQAIFEYECRRCKKIGGSTYFAAEGAGMKLVSTTTEFNPRSNAAADFRPSL